MGINRRFYWIKLPITYFNTLSQKKMRKQENGEVLQIIYLKMLLLSANKDGYIYYQGVYDTLAEEIAEEIAEEVGEVRKALIYFTENDLIKNSEQDLIIAGAVDMIGSETQVAERVRRYREKEKALQCNTNVTPMKHDVTMCNVEGEGEKEGEKEEEGEGRGREESNPEPEPQPEPLQLYGLNKRVELTQEEYKKLVESYGELTTNNYIAKADHAGEKRKRNIDHAFRYISAMIDSDRTKTSQDTNNNDLREIERLYQDEVLRA